MLKALCVGLASLVVAPSAHAEDRRLTNLERQLALATSPAVRAQAAVALAKTDDTQAVGALCKALAADPDAEVRTQVAKALGPLGGPDAEACLDKQRGDAVPQVRAAVLASLDNLRAERDDRKQRFVTLLPLDAAHNALGDEAGALAQRQLRHVLQRRGAWVQDKPLTVAQARALLKKLGLQGFALKLSLGKTDKGVSLDLLCTHYPTGGLIGDVTVKASGGSVPDLIRALVPKALDEAESTCGWREE